MREVDKYKKRQNNFKNIIIFDIHLRIEFSSNLRLTRVFTSIPIDINILWKCCARTLSIMQLLCQNAIIVSKTAQYIIHYTIHNALHNNLLCQYAIIVLP